MASATSSRRSSAAAAEPVRWRRSAWAGRSARGQDIEVVVDISFEQAVFGEQIDVTLKLPVACTDCDGIRRRRRHAAGHVQRLQRERSGAAGAPEPARPDGHRESVRSLRRHGSGDHHAVRDLPRPGPGHGRQDVPGRRARRCRQRLDAASHRPRRGRPAWRQVGRPVRPPAGRTRTSGTSATITTSSPTCRSRSPRRRSARRSNSRRSTASKQLVDPGRNAAGSRVRAASAGCAAPPWTRSRRPAGPGPGRGAAQADRPRGRTADRVRRGTRRSRRATPRKGSSPGSSRRSRDRLGTPPPSCDRCRCAAPVGGPCRRRLTSARDGDAVVVIDDDVEHHLRRVLRLRAGETGDGHRPRRAVAVATVVAGSREQLQLDVAGDGRARADRPARPITLAAAIPKGDRLDWMVQKLTELGVDRLVLLHAERSTTRWDDARAADAARAAAERIVARGVPAESPGLGDATSKVRCRRVDGPAGLRGRRAGRAAARTIRRRRSPSDRKAAGRTTSSPRRARSVSLGPNILRVETAAIAAAHALACCSAH